jgi:hypothetical protein
LCVACSIVLVIPALWSTVAYLAATSIAVIGLYLAYVTPVLLRRLNPEFKPGPWSLGRWSSAIGWTSIVWVVFICLLFVLPTTFPVSRANFNYTVLAVLAVLGGAAFWWVVSARRWFTGPQSTLGAEPGQPMRQTPGRHRAG